MFSLGRPPFTERFAVAVILVVAYCAWPHGSEAAQSRPVEGLWGSDLTSPDHPAWRIEDELLPSGPMAAYEHLTELLADAANDDRPLQELLAEARQVGQRYVQETLVRPLTDQPEAPPVDTVRCEPPPLIGTMMSPPAFLIAVDGEEVIIHHESWNTRRRIPLGDPGEVTVSHLVWEGRGHVSREKRSLLKPSA